MAIQVMSFLGGCDGPEMREQFLPFDLICHTSVRKLHPTPSHVANSNLIGLKQVTLKALLIAVLPHPPKVRYS